MFKGFLPMAENELGISEKRKGEQEKTKPSESIAECSRREQQEARQVEQGSQEGASPTEGLCQRPGEADVLTAPLAHPESVSF